MTAKERRPHRVVSDVLEQTAERGRVEEVCLPCG